MFDYRLHKSSSALAAHPFTSKCLVLSVGETIDMGVKEALVGCWVPFVAGCGLRSGSECLTLRFPSTTRCSTQCLIARPGVYNWGLFGAGSLRVSPPAAPCAILRYVCASSSKYADVAFGVRCQNFGSFQQTRRRRTLHPAFRRQPIPRLGLHCL